MDYSTESLNAITECAKSLMTPTSVSIQLGFNETDFMDDIHTPGNPARRAYFTGLEATDHELRQQLLDLMRAGSPSALADCQQRIERCLNEITM